jgi:hypothetical protein
MRPGEIRCPLPEREIIAKAAQKAAFGFFWSSEFDQAHFFGLTA